MSSSNIYNILSKLNALQPKAEEPKAQATKPIYESVEPRGSIMSGVAKLEQKLSEQFAADKKDLDTNPKNAAWDDDANAKQRARIAREKQKIGMQRKISGQDTGQPPAMEDAAPVKYGVFAKGGSIGSQRFKDEPLKTFDSKEEAIADAKRRRSGLSKGERGYYRMSYVVKPIKGATQVDEIDMSLVGDAVAGAAMGLGSVGLGSYIGHKIGNKIGQKFIDRDKRKEAEAGSEKMKAIEKARADRIAANKAYREHENLYGYEIEQDHPEYQNRVNLGNKKFRNMDVPSAFDEEQHVAEGFFGGARDAFYDYLIKRAKEKIPAEHHKDYDFDSMRSIDGTNNLVAKAKAAGHLKKKGVAEGFADMEADVKRRDAERRSGKKSTDTGVKHHGKYGTEYQGDADQEDAAAKAADKGPKKRGRPAKGQAKPKPAADEKKGRGRPKKAADPTYSGAKDLQNFMVGNLPKGKQAKGKVYKMDESRMLDEAGQHLDHILNRFKHEVRKFEETGDLDQDSDLYHALHDYYKETGLLPYDIEKGRGVVSPLTWVADQLDQHLGISEEAPAAPAAAPAFKPGDRVLYMGTFATVITCDGETCGIKMDKHPGTMMVPVSQIKKPSYDESSSVPAHDTEKKDFFHNPAVPDNEQLPATPGEIELNELAKLAGLTVETKAKPDYIDLDKDGNKKEPMAQAAQDAEDDDHDYANRLDDEQLDEGTCDKCDCAPCKCNEGNAFGAAVAKADGVQPGEKVKVGGKSYAVREAEEMINFMRNAGLDTSRAESALAEAYKYGDTDVEEAPEYANSPDEEIQNVDAITRQGNDLNREKKQFAGKPKAGDNPMASESADPLEAMGRRLMAAYESIKVVDEGMVDKVKGMFGKKKAPDDGTGNLFNEPAVKADTKAYLKKSAKQPNGPDNVKNIFDK
jgi:hypothetical protein